MSGFLSSVISSIGGDPQALQSALRPVIGAAPTAQQRPQGHFAPENTVKPTPPLTVPQKRKADTGHERAGSKEPRIEQAGASKPSQHAPAPKPPTSRSASPVHTPTRNGQLPYRGTARPTVAAPASTAARRPAPAAIKPPTTPATLKKGSYQEILARAKAAQQTSHAVGTITHKPVQKLSKRERERREAEDAAKAKQLAVKTTPNGTKIASKASTGKLQPGEPVPQDDRKKRPVELSYKGTMRPAHPPPPYKGTMAPSSSSVARPSATARKAASGGPLPRSTSVPMRPLPHEPKARYAGYASYSENDNEDDDDAEAEREGYDTDGSSLSDMEATGFEVEEEESASLAVAKREDEEARRAEEEMRRAKAERRTKLMRMAAGARARKL